ncbi:MAG: DoxX family protein [Bacteroidetes bacterium]|nr:DoxX family protein [Bacteroidota bacterium]
MKATKIIYWVSTILVLAMMLYSAYGTFFIHSKEGDEMMKAIAIPMYLMKLLAVGKALGAVAILVPGFPRLKEWAYAGYFFDLSGATFCFAASGFPFSAWVPMLVFVVLTLVSYFTYHKLRAPKV